MKRTWSVFRKSFLEQMRSPWELVMVLLIGPLFVGLYWLFFGGGSTSYSILVMNQDQGTLGQEWAETLSEVRYGNGQSLLKLLPVTDRAEAEVRLKDRDAVALVILPPDFSQSVAEFRRTGQVGQSPFVLVGDLTNPTYPVAAAVIGGVTEDYLRAVSEQPRPIPFVEEPLGGSGARSEFEMYVPGLLVVAVVMMIFTAAMRVTREIETGGLRRLALTRVTPLQYLAGVSGVQMLVGLMSVLFTFLTAIALGFHSQGPLWVAILVGALSSFSVIGVGLLVACFSRSTIEAFIFANFPMIFMMFFSGGVFPIQRIPLFTLAGRSFALFDIVPQTHAVLALNKVLTLGAGLSDIAFELTALLVLSLVYFAAGVAAFRRKL